MAANKTPPAPVFNRMDFAEIEALKRTISVSHGGTAYFVGVEPIRETADGGTARNCMVCVFNLTGNVTAVRAYAWAEQLGDGPNQRLVSFLHSGSIRSPRDAVRAAIAGGGEPR